ncbi:MAG: diguanylate cyclase, partial [Anaerolineae bacterium]|nr:diguanylate cyclase [Anaerolineae bacterium]
YLLLVLRRIVAKRREGAIYIMVASLVWAVAVVVETLSLRSILPYGQITSFSFLGYIFIQAILLAARFSKSFERVESLSTELEETNINLEESERKYRTIFEDSKDLIFIAGLDSQIRDVNPACIEVIGYTKSELKKMTILDVMVNPALRSEFKNTISAQGSVKNFEVKLQRKNGQKIDALVSATLRQNEEGKVIGVQGSVRDITSRKQARAERLRALEMQRGQERFRELSAATFEGVFIHDNGVILDINQAAEDLFGYTQAELIGKDVIELITTESRQIVTKHIQTGYEKPYELTGLRKDGSVFPLEVHVKIVSYQGNQVRVVAARDITERVQAEEQMQQALLETEELLAAAKAILGATDLKSICRNLISHFNELVQANRTTLILLNQDRKEVQLSIVHGSIEGEIYLSYEEVIAGISGMVLNSKEPIISLSADDDIEPEATRAYRMQNNAGPLIVVPLVTKAADGTSTVIGTTTAINLPEQRKFTQRDADLLMALTTQAAAVIENLRLFEETQVAKEASEVANQALEIANVNLKREIEERKRAEAKLQELATTDPLTEIYNRRHFFDLTEKELRRSKRSSTPISLIMFDIDHFKDVNDTYGHLTGDQVLVNLAKLCQKNIRHVDILGRFGGEEFVILMPDANRDSAKETAERLRQLIANKPIATSGEINISVTISIGIANWVAKSPVDTNTLLDQADQALYHAKETGRNQTIIWKDLNLQKNDPL